MLLDRVSTAGVVREQEGRSSLELGERSSASLATTTTPLMPYVVYSAHDDSIARAHKKAGHLHRLPGHRLGHHAMMLPKTPPKTPPTTPSKTLSTRNQMEVRKAPCVGG